MQKINRPLAPKWFLENKENWTKEGLNNLFDLDSKLKSELKNELLKMTDNHCSYCNIILLPIEHCTIDTFKPVSKFPNLSLEWTNLFIACPLCNKKKSDKYDEKLLKPDDLDYDFDKYFNINFKTGELEPNPLALKEDILSAKISIEIFGLNSFERPYERLQELQKAQNDNNKTINLKNLSFTFFIERGLKALKQKLTDIKIKSIKIKNIRCFTDISIDFDKNCNLIVGTNSRGKTTVLQLLTIGILNIDYIPFISNWYNIVRKDFEKGYFAIEILYKKEILKLEYEINQDDRIILLSEKSIIEKIKNIIVLGYGSNRNIKFYEEKPKNVKIQPIATLFGENDYLKHIRQLNTFLQLKSNFEILKVLINEIFDKSDNLNKVKLEKYDSEFTNEKPITFYFSTPTNKQEFIPLEALSDGFKSTFVWLFDMTIRIVENLGNIYNRREINGIIVIDEIDLHLHPQWQRTILPTLCELFPKIQFIVTTHSDLVAQSVDNKYIKKFILNEKENSVNITNVKYGKGSSSNFIYDNVFDIKETFDVETEAELKKFLQLRNSVLENKILVNDIKVKNIVEKLISKSKELELIVSQELNQIKRLTGQTFEL